MKMFCLILLSLGLVMAFSASAFAVDVQVSGSYYVAGMYLDQVNLAKSGTTGTEDLSTAFFYQRLRVKTDFLVSQGLKLVTSFDALEREWGGARSAPATSDYPYSIATRAEEQNIAFDLMYVEYASPIGLWKAGYVHENDWGTSNGFMQSVQNGHSTGGIKYRLPVTPFSFSAEFFKEQSNDYSAVNPTQTSTDVDYDRYILTATYDFKGGTVGILGGWDRLAQGKPYGVLINLYYLVPKFQAQFGPVNVQALFFYGSGSEAGETPWFVSPPAKAPTVPGPNVSAQDIMGDVEVDVNLGVVYFGGQFAYMSGPGNDPYNVKGGFSGGGNDWNPCLIMFNNDLTYWVGGINSPAGLNSSVPGVGMTNALFYQLDGGVRPIPKLDIKAAVAFAMADTVPTGYTNKSYGWELDVTGTYKITNNLSYMLGAGYWWVGDYYRGTDNSPIRDDYMLMNKLTLTF
jgi:hypothetical protein